VQLHPHLATAAELRACIDDLSVLVEHRQENRVSEVLLSVANQPAALESILARNTVRRGPDDIRVIRSEPVILTDPPTVFSGGDAGGHREGRSRVAELEWSASWRRPTT